MMQTVTRDDEIASGIARERAALYVRQRPILQLGNLLLQMCVVLPLWPSQSHTWLLAWLALNLLLMGGRARAAVALTHGDIRTAPDIRRWFRELTYTAGLGGLLWGTGALLFLEGDNPVHLAIFLLILMGVSWGAVASMSMHFPAVIAFIVPVSVMTALRLASFGADSSWMLAALTLGFMSFTLVTARNYAVSIDATLRLACENLQLLAEVTAGRDAAERSNAEKSRFLAALGHDVRQPLYAAGLFLEALGARLTTTEHRNIHTNAASSLQAVSELFDALLENSQLDHSPAQQKSQTFDVAALVRSLRQEFSAEAARHGIDLVCAGSPAVVRSDPLLVARILRNLISNAIKHAQVGSVTLETHARLDVVRVAVCDTGVGIVESDQARIFDEYTQVGRPARGHRRGLGLGLAVVKRLCCALGTDIELTSVPGCGATFTFTLPRGEREELPRGDAAETHDLVGIHILLIEDDDAVRGGLSMMLGDWRCLISAGASLSAALAIAEAQARPVDLVISDYRLADASGIEAIHMLRARYDTKLPALLLNGESHGNLTAEAAAAAIPVLTKPVAPARLREAIARAIA